MQQDSSSRKQYSVLARRKRMEILKDRRLKKRRIRDNGINPIESSKMHVPSPITGIKTPLAVPSKIHNRTPLSDITSATLNNPSWVNIVTPMSNATSSFFNERNSSFQTPGSTRDNSHTIMGLGTVGTKDTAASARRRRKVIMQRKMSQAYKLRDNYAKNRENLTGIDTASSSHFNTPLSDITNSWFNQANKNYFEQATTSGPKSKKQLNVGVIQDMTVKLFNYFGNNNHNSGSSSTSNINVQEPATFSFTSNVMVDSDHSHDETSTNDSVSDSSCEFNVAYENYDSTSSYDDVEPNDSNYISLDSSVTCMCP